MKKTQVLFIGVLGLLAVLALGGVIYLAFVFPKTVAVWADEGRALSVAEQTLANLSSLCVAFGLFLAPALLLGVVGCAVWAVYAANRTGHESANRRMGGARP